MSKYEDYAAGGQPLGSWLEDQFSKRPSVVRIQSAFADATSIAWVIDSARAVGASVHLVLGSGGQSLSASAAVAAVVVADFGGSFVVVDYTGALFHCKTYHFEFGDGTATAAVGSANCTLNGLGYNDESYVSLISSVTSEAASVAEVMAATDRWRSARQPNVYQMASYNDVVTAINARAIGVKPPTYTRTAGTGSPATRKARLWSPPAAAGTGGMFLPTGPTTIISPGPTSVPPWSKVLNPTDAQQNGGSKTNVLRLTSGKTTSTYFRDVLFDDLPWTSIVKTTGNARSARYQAKVYEEATADFIVTIAGSAYGLHSLKIDHAVHRIANQKNIPTLLHWGTTLADLLRGTSHTGRTVTSEKVATGLDSPTIA